MINRSIQTLGFSSSFLSGRSVIVHFFFFKSNGETDHFFYFILLFIHTILVSEPGWDYLIIRRGGHSNLLCITSSHWRTHA
ncbi:hypothetical protein F4703DRAFT_1834514, partial [Phycomyces blakesleeanus]